MEEKVERIVALLEAKLGKQFPAKPHLRLAECAPQGMDAAVRESHLRMIRSLRRSYRAYSMDLIVNRATLGKGSIDDLSDAEVLALHKDMHRAIDCIQNDIPFDIAGLIGEEPSCNLAS